MSIFEKYILILHIPYQKLVINLAMLYEFVGENTGETLLLYNANPTQNY